MLSRYHRHRKYPRIRIEQISIHPSFYLFWTLYCLLSRGAYIWDFVLAAVIHELGHIAAVALFGGEIQQLIFYAAGICMRIHHQRGYICDSVIAAAGPLAGMLAAVIGMKLGWYEFAGANFLLTMLNCLPILPLDGGCIVAYALCLSPAGLRGYDALRMMSLAGSVLLMGAGVYIWYLTGSNVSLLVIGITLFLGNCGFSCK